MIDVEAREAALRALVDRVVEIAPANWVQIYAAFEVHPGPSFTWVLLGAVNLGDRWGFGQFDLDDQVYDLAMTYREACGPDAWSTLELKVDYDGAFDAAQGYDPIGPGDTFGSALLDRLQSYGETFTREHGQAPHA